ncbi:MAG: putative DNA binding domain-containing protein [Bacteriovoracales bacterium]|nr:putative DNA binding domain-containing protein [Bacteriovoracales bacterium]
MNQLLQSLLSRGGECEWVEFKKNYCDPKEIGEYLSALGNSALIHDQKYGYLVFGIEDSSFKIIGTAFSHRKEKIGNEELENWTVRGLRPPTKFDILEFVEDGKNIVLFRVDASDGVPISFYGTEYIRIGSYKKKLKDHPEREEEIWAKKKGINFEDKIAIEGVNETDLFKLLDYPKYFDLMKLPLPSGQNLIDKLLKAGILSKVSSGGIGITNLGAILFARDLNDFDRLVRNSIRLIVYEGKGKTKCIKERERTEGYAIILDNLVENIANELPTSEEIKGALRIEIKSYSDVAIRELAINMLIHQDFNVRGTGPKIEIFDGRIEFTNPGQSIVAPLRLIDDDPASLNEKIVRIMRLMKLCEERGSGIDKVIRESEKFHLPAPEFIDGERFFKAILYAPMKFKVMSREDKVRACYQHCCLKYVSHEQMSNRSLRERFGIDAKNSSLISNIISDAISSKMIRPSNPQERSKKMARYLPYWA